MAPILLAFDGSPGAERALRHAARLFPGAEAVVVTVWHPYGRRAMPTTNVGVLDHAVREGARKEDAASAAEAEQIAAQGVELAVSLGLSATPRIVESDRNPGPALIALARELRPEAIVVGPRGLGALAAALRDGTTQHLALRSPVPVLVVPTDPEADAEAREA